MAAERRRVLVTGGAGYVGNAVCDRLVRGGHRVTVVDNLRSASSVPPPAPVEFVLGDARLGEFIAPLVEDVDAIVPLAALVGDDVERAPLEARSVNADALGMLIRLVRPDQLVVHVSTQEVYASTRGTISEHSRINPLNLEAQLASEAERHVLLHHDWAILRVGDVFGASRARRPGLRIHDLIEGALDRQMVSVTASPERLCPLHVGDLAEVIAQHVESDGPHAGRVLNIGTRRPGSISDLSRLVAWTLGVGLEIQSEEEEAPAASRGRIDFTAARTAGIEPKRKLWNELEALISWLQLTAPGLPQPVSRPES